MTDDIRSMVVNGYLCTLTSAGLVGIESSRNIYVPTLSLAHGLAIFPLRSSCSAYALPSVGIQGHAVAEAPTGVARALLYIVSGSPSFLLYLSSIMDP